MFSFLRRHTLLLMILALMVIGSFSSQTFMEHRNLKNVLISLSTIGVLALGQTPVMLMRQVDLSGGSLMAFAPIFSVWIAGIVLDTPEASIIQGGNYVVSGLYLVVIGTIFAAACIGTLNGFLIAYARVPSLIVTLGMLYILRGLAYVVSNGRPLYLTNLEGFDALGNTEFWGFAPASFCVFLGLGIALAMLFRFTRVGVRVYAAGNSERAATYSGISVRLWLMIAFTFSGFCSGVAALIYSSRLGSAEAAQANGYELVAIAVAVIGGTTLQGGRGGIVGTILAALVLGLVMNILSLAGVVVWYQTIVIGLVIVCSVFLYDRGARFSGAKVDREAT